MFLDQMVGKFKQVLGGSAQKMEQKLAPKMKICMLGARGVGKTSVITSMYYSQKQAVEGTDLFLIADSVTGSILDEKKQALEQIFDGYHEAGDFITDGGIAGDSQPTTFSFVYGMNSIHVNIGLEIRDYPGEYLISDPNTVAEYVREADAVVVAIDTPCLMEEDGRFNNGKNRPMLVSRFLMNHLDKGEEKLVLFVPLKCEKYANENRLGEVQARIQSVYADLFEYLRDRDNLHGMKKKICCAITPIKTLGGVEFDSFDFNYDGTISVTTLEDGTEIPNGINYRYIRADARYMPENCAQPLYYLLGFFSKQYEIMKKNESQSGMISRLRRFLAIEPNMDRFSIEATKFSNRRNQNMKNDLILFGKGRI